MSGSTDRGSDGAGGGRCDSTTTHRSSNHQQEAKNLHSHDDDDCRPTGAKQEHNGVTATTTTTASATSVDSHPMEQATASQQQPPAPPPQQQQQQEVAVVEQQHREQHLFVKVSGRICRRRSLGKHLAFCDVKQEDGSVVKLSFERSSPYWNSTESDNNNNNNNNNNNFPTKASSLPYGALVNVTAVKPSFQSETPSSGLLLQVHTWQLLENPKLQAQRIASCQDENGNATGGIDCSTYLRERGSLYAMYHDNHHHHKTNDGPKNDDRQITIQQKRPSKDSPKDKRTIPTTTTETDDDNIHGGNASKALRAKILGQFIIETFGVDRLRQGSGILDVAGGKGQLSMELANHNIPCTLIDPLLRKRAFPKRSIKRFVKQQLPLPTHCCKCFNSTDFVADYQWLVQNASMLVGLHPDECTEDILDVALQHHRNVVIVPCCVFPTLFPNRKLLDKKKHRNNNNNNNDDDAVLTYEDFCSYLLAKDSRLQMTSLPFEGRNQVIYLCQEDR